MAVVKVFSAKGIKTVVMLGNVSEQEYDPVEDVFVAVGDQDSDAEE